MSRHLTVVNVALTLPPVVGGSEAFIQSLSYGLIRNGHTVVNVGGTVGDVGDHEERDANGLITIRLKTLALSGPKHIRGHPDIRNLSPFTHDDYAYFQAGLVSVLEKIRPDIVIGHLLGPSLSRAVIDLTPSADKRFNIPHIYLGKANTSQIDTAREPGWTTTLACSNWHAMQLRQQAPDIKLGVLHPSVAGAQFDTNDVNDYIERLRAAGNTIIGLPSRLDPQKGQKFFIEALPQIADVLQSPHVVVGEAVSNSSSDQAAAYLDDLYDIARQVGFNGHLHSVPLTPNSMPGVLNSCDIVGFGSHARGKIVGEVCPIAPLEAMAAGKSIVTTVSGGMSDYVRPGTNAEVIPFTNRGEPDVDAIAAACVAANANAVTLGAGGRATAADFSDSKLINDLLARANQIDPSKTWELF